MGNFRQAQPGKATVLAIGKAVPSAVVLQEGLAERYLRDLNLLDDPVLLAKLQRLCNNTTVKTRYTVITEKMIRENPGFLVDGASTVGQRLKLSGDAVTKLGAEAATRALEEWGRPVEEITHLVYVSSSEIRLPGGDLHIAVALGLRKEVQRVMLYMLGCCGGGAGIRVAKDIAENNPGSRVLLTTSDNCLIGYRAPRPDHPYDLVGAALFGDGAAAMVIGTDPLTELETPWFELHRSFQTYIPGTVCTIEGTLSESGISFRLGRELPKLIENNIEEFVQLLSKELEGYDSVTYNDLFWAVHPGGPAILNAVEKQLNLSSEKLLCSRQVLADYGNINSNTIIYVLDYMRKRSLEKRRDQVLEPEWGFMLAFGPGITIEGMVARNLV